MLCCILSCILIAGCMSGPAKVQTKGDLANFAGTQTDMRGGSLSDSQGQGTVGKNNSTNQHYDNSIQRPELVHDQNGSIPNSVSHQGLVSQLLSDDPTIPGQLMPILETVRVSETFVENDVQEALHILASQAKTQVIIDDMVRGSTSAVIENETFEAALNKVLLPLGYVYRKVDDHYLIGLSDPASNLFRHIAERSDYHTRFLAPSELMELLPERFQPFVRTSEKRNLIIIEAPPQIAESIMIDLDRSDQPVDQVVLEVMICVYSPDKSKQLGIDLSHRNRAFDLALAGLKLASGSVDAGVQAVSHSSATLKALSSKGQVSIRARPQVTAKDGETAKISIAKETFFSVQPNAAGAFFRQEIEKIEAGISLDITPVIRGDQVTLQIGRAEVSEGIDNQRTMEGLTNNPFPTINRRHVETTVSVHDQETITIGGLVQRQIVDQVTKIPVLGDLRLVGKLFQRVDQREEETELIIFITPRILRREP